MDQNEAKFPALSAAPVVIPQASAAVEPFLERVSSLADAVRVRVLHVLGRHELGVAELCDVVQLPQSTVSRHLKGLTEQKWIAGRREGTNRLYRMIADELDPGSRKLWVVTREQTEAWPAVKQDRLRLDRVVRDRDVDSAAFFASAAGEWDRLRRDLYGERFSVAAMLSLLPGNTVVADLGCGSGNLAFELAPFVEKVIGVDTSAAMLKAAKRRAAGLENVDLRKGDLAELPVESASCDAALMVLALTYLPDPAAAVGEMARILKPGGRGVVVDLLPHDRDDFRRRTGQVSLGLDPDRIGSWMTAAGMQNPAHRPLDPEPNVKGPALFVASGIKVSGRICDGTVEPASVNVAIFYASAGSYTGSEETVANSPTSFVGPGMYTPAEAAMFARIRTQTGECHPEGGIEQAAEAYGATPNEVRVAYRYIDSIRPATAA